MISAGRQVDLLTSFIVHIISLKNYFIVSKLVQVNLLVYMSIVHSSIGAWLVSSRRRGSWSHHPTKTENTVRTAWMEWNIWEYCKTASKVSYLLYPFFYRVGLPGFHLTERRGLWDNLSRGQQRNPVVNKRAACWRA